MIVIAIHLTVTRSFGIDLKISEFESFVANLWAMFVTTVWQTTHAKLWYPQLVLHSFQRHRSFSFAFYLDPRKRGLKVGLNSSWKDCCDWGFEFGLVLGLVSKTLEAMAPLVRNLSTFCMITFEFRSYSTSSHLVRACLKHDPLKMK